MERSAKKRKAAASSPEGRDAKRQKTPDPYYVPETKETAQSVSKIGLDFIQSLKRARDKNSRLICTNFLTLPSKKDFPDYYEQTVMPLAVDILEGKLERYEYTKLTYLESDVKRMVNNAKSYNHNKSDIYLNAERIRKMTSNYMVKHNPAYSDKNYTAFATPLPLEAGTQAQVEGGDSDVDAEGEPDEEEVAKPVKAATMKLVANPKVEASTPAPAESSRKTRGGTTPHESLKRTQSALAALDPDDEGYDADYAGKTFQQAQRQLLNEMIKYRDDEGVEVFTPFLNLPPRSLTEYYEIIQQPTSLRSVMNKIIGFHGRAGATGVTELKSWDALDSEMSKIWDNCREFNQEGSDIYELAGELETYWNERCTAAKAKVEEPPQPPTAKLKLNLPPKAAPIKLRLGAKASPSPAPAALPPTTAKTISPPKGVTGQTISLQVPATAARQSPAKPSASPAPQSRPTNQRTISATLAGNVKAEATPTPAPLATIPTNTASSIMPPPATTPLPSAAIVSFPTQAVPPIQPYVPFHAPPTGLDSKWRPEGKSLTDALIYSLLITSHPSLALPNPFTHLLPASPLLSHHLLTLTLPYTHSILQFEPSLNPSLGGAPSSTPSHHANGKHTSPAVERRPYKLFVLVNGQRVQANFLPGQARLQYDVRLGVGMNRVEVECVALAAGDKQASPGTRSEALEVERIGVFINVLRM